MGTKHSDINEPDMEEDKTIYFIYKDYYNASGKKIRRKIAVSREEWEASWLRWWKVSDRRMEELDVWSR